MRARGISADFVGVGYGRTPPAAPERLMPSNVLGEKAVRKLLITTAMVISTSTPVAASDNSDVIAVVHRWTDAFSRRSFDTDIAPCAEDAVVIDDLPPHVWQGPGACSRWF